MIDILKTRLIHWKKQWMSLLFWLAFPTIGTILIIYTTTAIQQDSQVPVGIVLEENTPLASELYHTIQQTPLIRVVDVTEAEAKRKVETHELDSAFIIQEGYEEKIQKGNRNWLIKSYTSDLSFAYTPVKEMIISLVQEDTGRTKTAHIVRQISEGSSKQWSIEEIIVKAKEIQQEENLLRSTFSFADGEQSRSENEVTIWNTWGLWAVLSALSTLLIFDWVIKERKPILFSRYAFMRFSVKSYFLQNLLIYTIILFIIDLTTAYLFHVFLNEELTLNWAVLLFIHRLTMNTTAFLIGLLFRQILVYYSVSFVIALFIAIISGAVLPNDGLTSRFTWLEILNPLHSFLNEEWMNPWIIVCVVLIAIWKTRGVESHA
ncbi:ABC transporter permease [Oceanobacillus salinisoli]|uniref:ABC transporter permease n=1 Tax=Oceanobacillus salinisoli TaxID=2678611 RepID=UPI0018CC26FA|nr:ABC transporter permease [Oceanobacillus salinisoli]